MYCDMFFCEVLILLLCAHLLNIRYPNYNTLLLYYDDDNEVPRSSASINTHQLSIAADIASGISYFTAFPLCHGIFL